MRKLILNLPILMTVMVVIAAGCSKRDNPAQKPEEIKKDFNISSVTAPDSIALNQNFDVSVSLSSNDQYSYFYSLSLDNQVAYTKESSSNKITIETNGLKEGNYKLNISVKNSDGAVKETYKTLYVLTPVFGVAIFGNTKEKVIETEKNINGKDVYAALVGLESPLNKAQDVEKVMFRYSKSAGTTVYYFRNNKFIGGESYPTFLSNGNYYATYFGQKELFNNYFKDPGVTTDEHFSYFSKSQLDDLLSKHDYATISIYIRNGQYSVAHKWENSTTYANSYIKLGYQNAVTAHYEIALK